MMDSLNAQDQLAEPQGTFVQLDSLGQLFGEAPTSTTHRFPKRSLLSRSYDRPQELPNTIGVTNDEGRRPSDWSMASTSSNG